MVPIISTAYVTGIKKRTNCCHLWLQLSDNIAGKFEFTYKDGKPFLKVLDTSIKRVAAAQHIPPCRGFHHPEIPRKK